MKPINDVRYDLYRVNNTNNAYIQHKKVVYDKADTKLGSGIQSFNDLLSRKIHENQENISSKANVIEKEKASNLISRNEKEEIKISHHAERRLKERGIVLNEQSKSVLIEVMEELREKGAKDSLIITNNTAFLLNIPNRTLITAMTLDELRQKIFTQIDSVSIR